MTWIRLEDGYAKGGKHAVLSDGAFRLWHEMLSHSAENLTDGFVSDKTLASLPCLKALSDPEKSIRLTELVECKMRQEGTGLIERTVGGWLLHDYLEFQPSRATVLMKRKKAAAKKARQRECMRELRNARRASTPSPSPSTNGGMSPQVSPGDSPGGGPRVAAVTKSSPRLTDPTPVPRLVPPLHNAKR